MAASPVKFLLNFLIFSMTLWLLFIFLSKLLSWILSRKVGASVRFRLAGWKCLREVVVKFNKGPIESVSVGEVKLRIRQSLVGYISRDRKLQLLICDLEIVLRPPKKSNTEAKAKKPRLSSGKGRGKWMVLAKIAQYFSVSLTDFVLKTPKATVEVKELKVDIYKDGGSNSNLSVKLHIFPIIVNSGELQVSSDQSSNISDGGCLSADLSSCVMLEKSSALLICEEFSLTCQFGPDREVGIVIKNVDITSGEVTVNLHEELFSKSKKPSDSDKVTGSVVPLDSKGTRKKQDLAVSLSKFTPILPEKVV